MASPSDPGSLRGGGREKCRDLSDFGSSEGAKEETLIPIAQQSCGEQRRGTVPSSYEGERGLRHPSQIPVLAQERRIWS